MVIELNNLIILRKDHIKKASRMIGRAFMDDPTSLLAYPDEKERRTRLSYPHETFLRYNFPFFEAYTTTENLEGVAVWQLYKPRMARFSFWHFIVSGAIWPAFRIGLRAAKVMQSSMRSIEKKHQELAPIPHWYLAGLAVDPDYQGQGYASKLLRPMLARIDAEGLPCYLETATLKDVAIYQHFGFQVREEFLIPDKTLKLWLMLRGQIIN